MTLLQCTCMIFVYFRNCAVFRTAGKRPGVCLAKDDFFLKPLKNKIIGYTISIYSHCKSLTDITKIRLIFL